LLSVLLAHLLAKRREAEKELETKVLNFKESFIPLLKELESSNANPTTLVTQYYPEQDKAARTLLIHLPNRKKKAFQKYWSSYTELYEEKKSLGITALIATEVDDLSKANPGTQEGIAYLYEQTEKRRKIVINIINRALETI
jgi:hypothetical protein